MSLVITKEHGYLVLSTAAICVFSFTAGFLPGGMRSKIFSDSWRERKPVQALMDEHKKEVGTEFPKQGYPDMGNGRFAATLTYKEWLDFNNAQRAHYNLVENIAGVVGLHVLSGLFFPLYTSVSSVVWIGARSVWASNYAKDGPNARYNGIAGLHALCLLGWLGSSVFGGLRMAQLIKF